MTTTASWTREFPAEVGSPRAARRAAAAWVDSPCNGEFLLCISELVTNAVLHARSPVQLHVMREGNTVRVRVHDNDPTIPVLRNPSVDATTGRGLYLLDRLASTWGVESETTGKVVWFTMDLERVQR